MADRATISILGFGAFGRLAAAHLAPHADLRVHDPFLPKEGDGPVALPAGAALSTLNEAAEADWIILATPVQAMERALRALAPRVRPGAVVADVGSVKIRPVAWMLELLPGHAQVLGTHPMFGPETARERGTIEGEPIALCPARVDDRTLERARLLLGERLGLRIIEMTPDEHDRQAALVQGVTHLIGRAAAEMGLPDLPTGTLAYRRLLQMKRNTERDSPDLFEAIQGLNPYADAVRRDFLDALLRTLSGLEDGA